VESLSKLLAVQPGLTQGHVLLGSAYLGAGDGAKAAESFRRAQELTPRDPRPYYLRGLALRKDKKDALAEKEFEQALNLAPGFVEPLVQLVSLDFAARKPDVALERVNRQIGAQPKSAGLQYLLGRVHLTRKEVKQAEAALNRAIEMDPGLTPAYLALSQLYIASKEYDQALARLEEALKVNPGSVSALMLTGMIHQQKGEVPRAQEAYERLLDTKPDFAPAANNLAYIYSEHGGNLDKALELAYRARSAAPDDPHVADTLGWILYKKDKVEQALTSLQLSVNKLPDNAEVQYHLGMALYKQGNLEAAKQALRQALQLGTAFPGADEARRVLAQLEAS
jgi:tetratricopeptide (TPR) repeat protein